MPGKTKAGVDPLAKYTLGQKARKNNGLHEVLLPSGETCLARRPGVQGLIEAGLLDNFDQLTALVQTEHIDPHTVAGQISASRKVTAEQTQTAAQVLMADKEKLGTALNMMDRLAAYVVVAPPVWIDYQLKDEPDAEWLARRIKAEEDGALAIREVDMDDKMFLLNWAVGGSSDLAAFRTGTNELLGDLVTVEEVRLPS